MVNDKQMGPMTTTVKAGKHSISYSFNFSLSSNYLQVNNFFLSFCIFSDTVPGVTPSASIVFLFLLRFEKPLNTPLLPLAILYFLLDLYWKNSSGGESVLVSINSLHAILKH